MTGRKGEFLPAFVCGSLLIHGAVAGVLWWGEIPSDLPPVERDAGVMWISMEPHRSIPQREGGSPQARMNQVSQRDGDDPSPIRIESPVPSDRETATPPGGEREPASDTDGVISSEVVPTPGEHQTLREPDTRGPSHTADPWDGFLQAVHEEIERHRAYPWRARLSNLEGVAWVVFSLGRDGRTTRVDLYRSSGHGILDRAAVDTIRRIPMFPPIPDGIAAPEVELAVPLLFRIDEAE